MATVRERVLGTGDTTWQVRWRDGKIETSRSFGTRKEADELKDLLDRFGVAEGLRLATERATHGRNAMTLDKLAGLHFTARESDVTGGKITPRTLADYRRDYEKWISPALGRRAAAAITTADVADLVDDLKTELSAKRVLDMHGLLYAIFKWGASPLRRLVPENPCQHTENLPAKRRKPPKGLRLPELHALLEAGKAKPALQDAADIVAFLAGTGWRSGEAFALTVGQVEDDGTSVYVEVDRVYRRHEGIVDDAKSEAGLRRLRVLGPGVAVLRRRIAGRSPGDPVFTTARGNTWTHTPFRRHWDRLVAAAGLQGREPTPHWLRHTHVFVCHAAGLTLPEIQRRIGHSDIKMTINVYGRLIDDMSDDSATRLDKLLTPGSLDRLVVGEVIGAVDEKPSTPALPENVALALAQAVAAGTMPPEQLAAMLAGMQAAQTAVADELDAPVKGELVSDGR